MEDLGVPRSGKPRLVVRAVDTGDLSQKDMSRCFPTLFLEAAAMLRKLREAPSAASICCDNTRSQGSLEATSSPSSLCPTSACHYLWRMTMVLLHFCIPDVHTFLSLANPALNHVEKGICEWPALEWWQGSLDNRSFHTQGHQSLLRSVIVILKGKKKTLLVTWQGEHMSFKGPTRPPHHLCFSFWVFYHRS